MGRLRRLLPEAHREYNEQVMSGKMRYDVFVIRFVHGNWHTGAGSASARNSHRQAIRLLEDLLLRHRELAEEFFRATLTVEEVDSLIDRYCKGDPKPAGDAGGGSPSFRSRLSGEDLELLAACMNGIQMFDCEVPSAVVGDLLDGRIESPLTVVKTGALAYLMDNLSNLGLVYGRWQHMFGNGGALLSRDGRPLNAHVLASALHRSKDGLKQKGEIDAYVSHFKTKYGSRDIVTTHKP